ncbi:MAG: glutathione-regulated potassium-efflux system oxidoreductase KefF [Aeromicrobium sp.]|nr:glutathione-regulated potassium-efflux system oxidoreductase KefF [Burkholderiales bacterium]
MILVISAHPYPQRSRASRALIDAVRDLPGVAVRSLYDKYPDFDIDVEAEQTALTAARVVVWLHPIYWYSVPGLLKHWFDVVLTRGWAYGGGAAALAGKACLWVTTTGGTSETYTEQGVHQRPFDAFVAPVEQTAKFCGMRWLAPLHFYGAHVISDAELASHAALFRARLIEWQQQREGAGEGGGDVS